MQIQANTISHSTLLSLVDAGAPLGAEVVGATGGWGVVIKYGRARKTLAVQRGEPRTFRKFETVAAYLKELGITELRVHTGEFEATALPSPTDRRGELASARMKLAHQAAAHDKWIREHVAQALADANDPEADPSIPHAIVKGNMARQRAELRARIAKGK